jgi:hypothetical protein
MKNSNRKPAGGYGSAVNREVGVRVGDRSRNVNPRSVSQIGQQLSNHATEGSGKLGRAAETFYGGRAPQGGPGGVPAGQRRRVERSRRRTWEGSRLCLQVGLELCDRSRQSRRDATRNRQTHLPWL